MSLSGGNIAANLGAGNKPAKSGGAIKSAISRVTTSETASADERDKKTNGDSETAEIGKNGENNNLTSANKSHAESRLNSTLKNLTAQGMFANTLPPGMFNKNLFVNPWGMGLGGALGASRDDGARVANKNINYDGPGGGNDPAGGSVPTNKDPLYKGEVKPTNITVLGASDSGEVAYGTGQGTLIAEHMSKRIASGESLGSVLNGLNGNVLEFGQRPHLTTTGFGLSSVSSNASADYTLPNGKIIEGNRVSGTGIVLIGEDGSGEYHVGTERGGQKMAEAMRSIGLDVKVVYTEDQYMEEVKQAKARAEASGGKDLLWVHAEAHGNSNRQNGGHDKNDIGFVSVGNVAIHEVNLIGHAAYAHESHTDVLVTTGACHSGAINAESLNEYLDTLIRTKVPEDKAENKANDKPTDRQTGSTNEPKANSDTLVAQVDKSIEEKEKEKENRFSGLEIEIA